MTATNYPTDFMDNPDGRDYHYRFHGNDEEAWKLLKFARWKGRYIEMYPRDMKHLRTEIGHVTLKTYDKMNHIKGMKKYALSPDWQKVPFSRGKAEMKHDNGGGTKIRAKERISEKYGEVTVKFHINSTPGEVVDAFENGVNEDEVTEQIREAKHWAIEDKMEELRQAEADAIDECDHQHVIRNERAGDIAYCEDCPKGWHDPLEFEYQEENDELTVVGTTA